MSAVIEVSGTRASVDGFAFTSDDDSLEAMLNAFIRAAFPFGPEGSDPNPSATAARLAAKEFHGRVISIEPAVRVPGRIY